MKLFLAHFNLETRNYMGETRNANHYRLIYADSEKHAIQKLELAYQSVEYSYYYDLQNIEISEAL